MTTCPICNTNPSLPWNDWCVECYTNRRAIKLRQSVHYIYILVDPRDSRIHYVGHTNNLEQRYKGHFSDARVATRKNPMKARWFNDMIDHGVEPVMVVIDICDYENRYAVEYEWSHRLRDLGAILYNRDT